jgi:hypothetical protein
MEKGVGRDAADCHLMGLADVAEGAPPAIGQNIGRVYAGGPVRFLFSAEIGDA